MIKNENEAIIDITSPVSGGNLGGIIVDTHVHKVSKRIGWSKGAKNPEGTRKVLEGIAPPEHWDELTVLLIGKNSNRQFSCNTHTLLYHFILIEWMTDKALSMQIY